MKVVSNRDGGIFFIYGHEGIGKKFIWKTLSCAIRSRGQIVLTIASSGIVSLLLIGGRTAHSRFSIPLNVNEDSTYNIRPGTELVELIQKIELIIWDETPMTHRHFFEALDRSLRDIIRTNKGCSIDRPFGGKVVVFGGDFRQILPVVPRGSRQYIILATIKSSYLLDFCQVLRLTTNMRLQVNGNQRNSSELKEFSKCILKVGDGRVGEENNEDETIVIPDDLLIKDSCDPFSSIIDFTYPSVVDKLWDMSYFKERAILAPTHEIAESVNELMLAKTDGEEKVYISSDTISNVDMTSDLDLNLYSPDFLNNIRCSGLLNHKLKLKVGVPIILIRNINQSEGLCNDTRLQVLKLGSHVIEAKIITGRNIGHKVFIPRMILSLSDTKFPFKLQRR